MKYDTRRLEATVEVLEATGRDVTACVRTETGVGRDKCKRKRVRLSMQEVVLADLVNEEKRELRKKWKVGEERVRNLRSSRSRSRMSRSRCIPAWRDNKRKQRCESESSEWLGI